LKELKMVMTYPYSFGTVMEVVPVKKDMVFAECMREVVEEGFEELSGHLPYRCLYKACDTNVVKTLVGAASPPFNFRPMNTPPPAGCTILRLRAVAL